MTTDSDEAFADGFLSEAARRLRDDVHRAHRKHASLTYATNRHAVALQHALVIHKTSLNEALAAALYARTLASVQSAVLLLEHGLPVQARTVLRAALESLFQLAAISAEPGVADRLLASHNADRRTLADRISQWKAPELRASIESKLSQSDLDAMLASKASSTNIHSLAKLAGMEDWYHTVYTLLSFAAHSKVSDLEQHIVVDEQGEPKEFRNEPDIANQEAVWSWVIEVTLAAMRSVCTVFGLDTIEVERLRQEFATQVASAGASQETPSK